MKKDVAFMTSPIGDLPINSNGLRKAVDELARLNFYIHSLEERDKITQDAVVSLKENNAKLIKQNNKLEEQIVKLKESNEEYMNLLINKYTFKTTDDGVQCNVFDIVRKATAKEFAGRLKEKCFNGYQAGMKILEETEIDNLLKEYLYRYYSC